MTRLLEFLGVQTETVHPFLKLFGNLRIVSQEIKKSQLIGDMVLKNIFPQLIKIEQGNGQASTGRWQLGEGNRLVGTIRPPVVSTDIIAGEAPGVV